MRPRQTHLKINILPMGSSSLIRPICAEYYPIGPELDRLVTELLRPEGVELPVGEEPPTWRPVGTYREAFRPSDCVCASARISRAIEALGKPAGITSKEGPYWMAQWRPHLLGSKGYIAGWCFNPGRFEEWYHWATAPHLPHAVCLAGLLTALRLSTPPERPTNSFCA